MELLNIVHDKRTVAIDVLLIAVCAGIVSLLLYFVNKGLIDVIGEILTILACLSIGYLLYVLFLMILRVISEYDAEEIPFGISISILAKGFHII